MKKALAKVAVIEDDELLGKTLSEELEDSDFKVVLAKDGVSGLELVEKEKPDLILLDIVMPNMNGMEMFEKLRATEWGQSILVIFLTNKQPDDKTIRSITKGEASYYLLKSNYELSQVIEKVKEVLSIK